MSDQHLHWDSTYQGNNSYFGEGPSEVGKEAIALFKKERVAKILELGCGQGRDTIPLADAGFNVTGIDYSAVSCKQLKGKDDRIKTICLDVHNGPPFDDEEFDACFSHMFFTMPFADDELYDILIEVRRVIKPGSLVVYSVRTKDDPHFGQGRRITDNIWENNGFEVRFFDEDDIAAFSRDFEIVSIRHFREGGLPKRLFSVVMRKPVG